MLGNDSCDQSCLNQACDNDKGDCDSMQCSPGCFTYMINDGICQNECHTEMCGYDDGDCDCSPGCTTALLNNTVCDTLCATKDCNFDNFACVRARQGYCALGCMNSTIGDGHCDSACNNVQCNWDSLDCGCAAGCSFTDLGTCKPSCLVPDCNYDAYPGYPSCSSALYTTSARYYHLLTRVFTATYSYLACQTIAPTCTGAKFTASLLTCQQECNVGVCLYSFGNCQHAQGDCLAPISNVSQSCLKCKPGLVSYFTDCGHTCPGGYEPHSLVANLCYPKEDTTTEEHPTVYYVDNAEMSEKGLGTLDKPFHSLSVAFATLTTRYTSILLLPGTHVLSLNQTSLFMQSISGGVVTVGPGESSMSTQIVNIAKLVVAAADPEDPPTLLYSNTNPVTLTTAGPIEYRNIKFDGRTPLSNCTAPRCYYCSYIALDSRDGVLKTDRGTPIGAEQYLNSMYCQNFLGSSFMSTSGNELTLTNVEFIGFRQGFDYLISLSSGNCTFSSVSFTDIIVNSAVVSQNPWTNVPVCYGNFFVYKVGTVQLLNNGFEYRSDIQKPGFFRSVCMGALVIESVEFKYNFMPVGSDVTVNTDTAAGSLVSLDICLSARFTSCVFHHNFGAYGTALRLYSSTLTWESLAADPAYLPLMTISHFTIEGCTFRNNTGRQGSSLYFHFAKDLQTVVISDCTFENELALQDGVLSIANLATLDEFEQKGQEKVIVDNYGNRVKMFFQPNKVAIEKTSFQNCFTNGSGIIQIKLMANIVISSLTVQGGTEGAAAFSNTLKDYTLRDDIYMKNQLAGTPCICGAVISVVSCYNVRMFTSQLKSVGCSQGPILSLVSLQETVTLDSLTFSSCRSSVAGGGVIDISYSDEAALTNVNVLSCQNTGKLTHSIVRVQGSPVFTLHSSTFQSNSADYYGALVLQDVPEVSVQTSVFTSNSAIASIGGALTLLLPSASQVAISYSSFLGNSAYEGGGIYMEPSGTDCTIALHIEESVFKENSGNLGSGVRIAGDISFEDSSAVHACRFVKNQATRGAVVLEYDSGVLSFSNCTFSANTGTSESIIVATFSADADTELRFTDDIFINNIGPYGIHLAGRDGLERVTMKGVLFQSNNGILLNIENTVINVVDAVFVNNTADSHPVFSLGSLSIGNFSSVSFSQNTANVSNAGVGIVGGQSTFICSKCTFTRNKAARKAAALYLEQNSIVNITSSAFTGNTAEESGSALYSLGCEVASELRDCTFTDNFSGGDGVIILISSSLKMTSGQIHDNKSTKNTAGVVLHLSNLTATDITFSSQSGVSGTFMYITTESMAKIVNCHFQGGLATSSGAAITVIGSSLSVAGSTFEQLESPLGSALFVYSHSVLSVITSSFSVQNITDQRGGCIYLYESSFDGKSSTFEENTDSAVVAEKAEISLSTISFESTCHIESTGLQGVGLLCSSCPLATVIDCTFRDLTGTSTGAIDFSGGPDTKARLVIENSHFCNNTAPQGGAVIVTNADCVIDWCEFKRNHASSKEAGVGGAVNFLCPLSTVDCHFTIVGSVFAENTAEVKGGGVAWSDVMPHVSDSQFTRNSAPYGSAISSYATRLVTSHSLTLPEVASGQAFAGALELSLVDHYGQVVGIDSDSTAEMTSKEAAVTGTNKVTAVKGVFTFRNFVIIATPGSNVSISVSTNAVDSSKKLRSGDNVEYSSVVSLKAAMRNCTKGESEVNGQCVICGQGQYSLDPKLSCQDCPSAAICYGNYTMVPRSGYWRSSMDTSTFFACPYKPACIGSPEPPHELSFTGLCAEGYEGNLCQSCDSGYSRKSKAECSKCPTPYINAIRLAGIALITIFVVVILVKSSIASAKQPKALHSVYLKIFMNYLQLVMLTATFNLSWPSFVLELFSAQESAGDVTEQVFSIDCFINQDSSSDVFFDKLLLMSFVPLILLLAAVIVWLVVACRRRSLQCLRNELFGTCIILFFLAHPSIVKSMFSIFSCRQINPGEYWATAQLNIRCWQGEHLEYALSVALPSIILWGIGIPTACLFAIMIERKHFHLEDMKIRFGFLVNGYRQAAYYWEFVILYRKLTIICISVFLSQVSISVQALSIMGVLVFVVVLQKKHRPYLKKSLNETEMRSILVAATTIYCGLYYLTEDLGEPSKILLFLIIVVANGYFLLTWLHHMMGVTLIYLMKKVPILNRCFHAKSEEALGLARKQDFFEMELAYNWQREEIPPPTMKDLYMAYLQDRIPVTPASDPDSSI